MCGIAGAVQLAGDGPAKAVSSAVLRALSRRGPDAQHEWREGPCALYHCRLRVLDTSERADQPMTQGDAGRVVMIYNGETYNFRDLRGELERAGDRFRTASDAEVLLAGYARWGIDVFRRARGMWAAAFWHPAERRLVLARDPLGKKPLLYHAHGSRVAFASNGAALLALLDGTPAVDRGALECYLGHLWVPDEHAIFAGVHKVPPGCVVTWTPAAEPRVETYWRVPDAPSRRVTGEPAAEVERLLRQAVRRRLVSDVPLGVFLSAGLDSSLVAALAAQESGQQLVAVTAGTAGAPDDERPLARLVAERYGLAHRPIEVPPVSAAALPSLLGELGEPFGDSSILPSYAVARAARREMTVALTGDGGDEGFFGYDTFRGVRLAARYRAMVPAAVRGWLRDRLDGATTGWQRRAGALTEYGAAPLARSFRNRMGFGPAVRRQLLGDAAVHGAEHVYAERLERWRDLPDADALRRTFFTTFLPSDYLTKVDLATMAASLEARCPFLDVDLVEYLLGLPQDVAFPGGRAKALLDPLARRLLPTELLGRRKTGFGVPVGAWMRGELRASLDEFVFRSGTALAEWIDTDVARDVHRAHLAGADHSTRLWGLLALGVWTAVVVERRWPASDPLPLSAPAGAAA